MPSNRTRPQRGFAQEILTWYDRHGRDFPWRNTQEPYEVLVAEIMLRKTTASLVATVFSRFIRRYPTVEALADGSEARIRLLLHPLGIADRARLMILAAQSIVASHDRRVPHKLEDLLTLPGVGPYTANAIRCFAFGESAALVDTNIVRILERALSIRSTRPRAHTDPVLWVAAGKLLPPQRVREYNLGLLDLGALVCKAKSPLCSCCPVAEACDAYNSIRRRSLEPR